MAGALIVASCSGSGTGATSDSEQTSGTQPAATVPDVSAPIIDVVDPAGSMIDAELALRAEDRERAGLANLGPGAVELAAAMDASVAKLLAVIRTDAAAATAAAADAPPTSSPLKSGLAKTRLRVPSPGFNSMMVWATLLSTLGDFAQNPISATNEGQPETVDVGGNTGTVTTTVTVNATVTGSKLSVDLTFKTKGQVVDRATGAIVYSIDSTASGHVDVDFCPDSGGHAPAHVKLTSNETYSQGGGAGKGISKEMSADVGITVGDDAKIVKVEGTVQGSEESQGGVPAAGGGGSELTASTRTSSDNIANDGNGNRLSSVPRDIKVGGENTTIDEQVKMWGTTNLFMETTVTAAAKEAEKLWRSGKCVELTVDPDGGDVEPDEVKEVTAILKHKIEGNELDKPVEATLTGVKTVEPAGEKQPAPATVTYTAGSEDGDIGKIAFKSVSNRGIAEKAVTFTVRPAAWTVSFNGTDTETFGPVTNSFTAAITDLTVKAKDNVLSGTGNLRLTGNVTTSAGGAAECIGPLDQVATAAVTGTLVGEAPDTVLRIVVRSTSPAGQTVHMTCTNLFGQVTEVDLPDEGHAERFSETLAEFDLPAAGGSVPISKSAAIGGVLQVTIGGTFVVTKDH
ncbi:MAG: hypothetical protein QOJ08_490 [Ilumatobacteraceae bacterium]